MMTSSDENLGLGRKPSTPPKQSPPLMPEALTSSEVESLRQKKNENADFYQKAFAHRQSTPSNAS